MNFNEEKMPALNGRFGASRVFPHEQFSGNLKVNIILHTLHNKICSKFVCYFEILPISYIFIGRKNKDT